MFCVSTGLQHQYSSPVLESGNSSTQHSSTLRASDGQRSPYS